MGIMHILWSILVGFIIGLIARALMPGVQNLGFLMTTVLGICGSLLGGFLGSLISKPRDGAMFHPAGFIMSILGSLLLLFLWRFVH